MHVPGLAVVPGLLGAGAPVAAGGTGSGLGTLEGSGVVGLVWGADGNVGDGFGTPGPGSAFFPAPFGALPGPGCLDGSSLQTGQVPCGMLGGHAFGVGVGLGLGVLCPGVGACVGLGVFDPWLGPADGAEPLPQGSVSHRLSPVLKPAANTQPWSFSVISRRRAGRPSCFEFKTVRTSSPATRPPPGRCQLVSDC